MPGKFWIVMLEKDREGYLDWSCEKWRSITKIQGGQDYIKTIKGRKAPWMCRIFRRNCLLKHVVEGNVERWGKVTRSLRRRHKPLLDDTKETRGYWKLNEETLHRHLWRTCFRWGYGPVVREADECMMSSLKQ
jgi:hypothetical protein